jgi:5-methylcytosine-specific restriction protein A
MRSVDEWIGKTDDSAPPPRVKARVWKRNPICVRCGLPTNDSTRKPEFDHIVALCNGGSNRESNLQIMCRGCHRVKTYTDVAVKASDAKRLKKRLGLKPRRTIPGRRFNGEPIPSRWR